MIAHWSHQFNLLTARKAYYLTGAILLFLIPHIMIYTDIKIFTSDQSREYMKGFIGIKRCTGTGGVGQNIYHRIISAIKASRNANVVFYVIFHIDNNLKIFLEN